MNIKSTVPIFGLFMAVLGSVLCFSSCENPVGLGVKLNLTPPAVSIESPDFMENVGNDFVISGTASDKEGIALLSITVEYMNKNGWKQEFRSERGVWSRRSSLSPDWEGVGNKGTWVSRNNVIEWSIDAAMPEDADNGEYLISVSVENSVKRASAVQQQRIVKDTSPPVVDILAPVLELYKDEEELYSYEEIGAMFDAYKLRDSSILDRLHNGEIEVQYEITDDFSLDSLYFQLADNKGNIYYNRDKIALENMSWSGKTTITADEVTDIEGNPLTEKKYLQLLSTVTDKAGNIEQTRSQGWFVWWPDADKPWVSGFGHESDPKEFEVYPGSSVQGQAHDNKSVYSVSYKIYIKDDGGNWQLYDNEEKNEKYHGEGVLSNNPLEEGMPPSAFFNWTITSPKKCAEYKIVIDCEDSNGNKGETEVRYFYVYDVDAPSITLESPSAQETLFGDKDGKFTVSGIVGDGVEPKSLRMVWLNPNAADSRVSYQSAEYMGGDGDGWDIADLDGEKDDQENIVWELELVPKGKNEDGRVEKTFSKSLNLFSDLNIGTEAGKSHLTAQSFILRVVGNSGRAVTSLHSIRGDIQPPSVSIDRIIAKREGVEIQNHTTDELKNEPMDFLLEGDEIYLSGTWDDDSAAVWKDADKMGNFEVKWNGDTVDASLKYDAANSTWEAGPISYQGEGSGDIKVSLQDIGNNMAQNSFTARINTNKPVLIFITSDKSDGAYKADEDINIYLEFNKDVTYTGSDTPFLTLNNEKRAERTGGNGTMRHIFTYKVASGDDTELLTVSEINFGSGKWTGGGDAEMIIPAEKNLGDTKKIKIDTTAPVISKVESLTESGSYRAGRTFYLRLSFDENIIFTPGAGGAQLTLDELIESAADGNTDNLTQGVSGQNSLLFSYTVKAGENTDNLSVAGFVLADGARLTDTAGNSLIDFTVPAGKNIADNLSSGKIIIDTEKPDALIIGANDTQNFFEIESGQETGASVEYQVNGGDWLVYDEDNIRPFAVAGTYRILARQIDAAGNVSDNSNEIALTIVAKGPLLISFGGSPPGTYGLNRDIAVILNLREAVTVTGTPELELQFGNTTGTAVFDTSGSSSDKLKFSYKTQTGDDAEAVEIKSINLDGVVLKTANGADVSKELADAVQLRLDNNQGLTFYTRIAIVTSVPVFEGAEFNSAENKLTIRFSKSIFKGAGNITLTQVDEYLAPAVLHRDEYSRFSGLGSYYTIGTSNTDADGKPDLTEKYILNFGINTDGTEIDSDEPTGYDGRLIETLKGQGADKVIIPVVSSAVTVAGDDNDTLEIFLSGSYAFPVKGVEYALSFGAGLVRDELNNPVDSTTDYKNQAAPVKPSGINPVFIRINKEKARIVWDENKNIGTNGSGVNQGNGHYSSNQPNNGEFKIDCQTPSAQLSYTKTLVNSPMKDNFSGTPQAPVFAMPKINVDYTATPYTHVIDEYPERHEYYYKERSDIARGDVGKPIFKIDLAEVEPSYERNASIPLIPASFAETSDFGNLREKHGIPTPGDGYVAGTKEYGFVIGIMAQAIVKDGDTIIAKAEPVYEKAARSTIQFNSPPNFNVLPESTTQLWIRGGDRPSGDNATPGFPLSWDERDFSGIQLMHVENGHDWYWITWEVNETMYFHFLAGTTPRDNGGSENELQQYGPIEWAWAQGAWAFQHDLYILHPGASLKFYFNSGNGGRTSMDTPNEADYGWPDFTGKRSGPALLRRASRQ